VSAAPQQKASAPKRRRRGIERTNKILEATLRILAREGASAVTHRAVAEEAGVPIAATTYYFESKDDLLSGAFRRHAENEAMRVSAAISNLEEDATVDELADRLGDYLFEGLNAARPSILAEHELLLQAARSPDLETYSRVFYQSIGDQIGTVMRNIGSESPEADTILILATMAGVEVDSLSTPGTSLGRPALRELMRRLVGSLLRGPE
jgi:DNA-binding transcriptional regulator YbjK